MVVKSRSSFLLLQKIEPHKLFSISDFDNSEIDFDNSFFNTLYVGQYQTEVQYVAILKHLSTLPKAKITLTKRPKHVF